MSAADRVFDGLNESQRGAVEAVEGPVCILAGAGTGKTTTITRRLAYQVASGYLPPHALLAVTFTDKAAGEMRTRLRSLGVEGVRAMTFHAAALGQLRRFAPHRAGEVLSSKAPLVVPLCRSLPKPYRFVPSSDVAAEIEWAKNQRIAPAGYVDALGDHEPPIPADLMHGVYERYERRKASAGAIDFEDMLELAIQMLDDRSIRTELTAEYQAFTVDEYQDVNLLQQTLLERWLDGRSDVCVVGDDYQAIYSFTGASPAYLLAFAERMPGTRVVRLETNYRSTPQVLDAANRLSVRLGGATKKLRATNEDGPAPVVKGFPTAHAELCFVADEIRRLNVAGMALEDMAILYRTNARSEDHEASLTQHGIPYQVRDAGFLQRAAARQLRPRLRDDDATDVAAQVRRAATTIGYAEDADEHAGREEQTRQNDLRRFVEIAEELEDGELTLRGFVEEVGRRFGHGGDGGVNLLTLHRAKGLEFEAVFIPKVEANELPHRRADVAEERRLFYVGLTRAKTHLFVTWSRQGSGRSPFVEEMSPPTPPPTPVIEVDDGGDDDLLAALRSWRRQRAQNDGVPAYVVAHDATLADVARIRPRSKGELFRVHGFGPAKIERYADEILSVVAARRDVAASPEG